MYIMDIIKIKELIENIIVKMVIGEIVLKQDSTFKGFFESIKKSLNIFENVKVEMGKKLSIKEINDITIRIDNVLKNMSNMQIGTNPHY